MHKATSVEKGESKMLIIFGTSVFKTSSLSHLQILLMAARASASTMGDSQSRLLRASTDGEGK